MEYGKDGIRAVEDERSNQLEHGFDLDNDSQLSTQLIEAAISFAMASFGATCATELGITVPKSAPPFWPKTWEWNSEWAQDPMRCLVKAGALICAEIDRRLATGVTGGVMPDLVKNTTKTVSDVLDLAEQLENPSLEDLVLHLSEDEEWNGNPGNVQVVMITINMLCEEGQKLFPDAGGTEDLTAAQWGQVYDALRERRIAA